MKKVRFWLQVKKDNNQNSNEENNYSQVDNNQIHNEETSNEILNDNQPSENENLDSNDKNSEVSENNNSQFDNNQLPNEETSNEISNNNQPDENENLCSNDKNNEVSENNKTDSNNQNENYFSEFVENYHEQLEKEIIINEKIKEKLKNKNTRRTTSNGFAFNDGEAKIPDSLINNLIDNFLNKKFANRNSDLNVGGNTLEKDFGYDKWDITKLIKHKVTKQYDEMLRDKYSYKKNDKKSESIPIAFYFDLSGSMIRASHILSLIAVKILQKKIKLLIGFNNHIRYQIDELPEDKTVNIKTFQNSLSDKPNDEKLQYILINQNLENYLIEKKAEQVVLFTDFDPLNEVINLSQKTKLHWFCFEENFSPLQISNFRGHFFHIKEPKDILFHMKNVDSPKSKVIKEDDLWK